MINYRVANRVPNIAFHYRKNPNKIQKKTRIVIEINHNQCLILTRIMYRKRLQLNTAKVSSGIPQKTPVEY